MANILTAGFLKGYRTYILAAVGLISAAAGYAVGDLTLTQTIQAAAASLGLGTLRAAV